MTGRDVEYVFPRAAPATAPGGAPVLRVEGLARAGRVRPLDLDAAPGEIVGLAGLVGSGRSEILETIYGARRPTAGRSASTGSALRPGSVRAAVRAGLGLAPEERKAQGLLMLESVTRNVSVSSLSRFSHAGWLDRSAERSGGREADRELLAAARRPVRARCAPCPAATSRRPCSPAGCCAAAACCSSTSRPAASTSAPAPSCTRVIRRLADEGLGRAAGLQRGARGARPGRPGAGAPRGPRRPRRRPPARLDEHRVLDLVMEGSAGVTGRRRRLPAEDTADEVPC